MVLILTFLMALFWQSSAYAERQSTVESFVRLEEILRDQLDSLALNAGEIFPVIIVRAVPSYEESRTSFADSSIQKLSGAFGPSNVRYCEGCSASHSKIRDSGVEVISPDSMTLADISDFDTAMRGATPPAQTAWWLIENADGITVRGVSLSSGRVVFAQNISPNLASQLRTQRNYTASKDLLRRHRGDSLTHTVFDLGFYPSQHIALDFLEQWGSFNQRFFGVSVSLLDPVLGLGASYGEAFPNLMNTMLGGKLLMSVPTALIRSLTRNLGGDTPTQLVDPLLTLVGVARVPMPILNGDYALNLFASTNGKVGIGVSTLNTSFLPVLP